MAARPRTILSSDGAGMVESALAMGNSRHSFCLDREPFVGMDDLWPLCFCRAEIYMCMCACMYVHM